MIKRVQEHQEDLGASMSSPICYEAANTLRAEGEDIRSDCAPWLRLKDHQLLYTKPEHRQKQSKIASFLSGNKRVAERMSYCAFPETVGGSGVRFCRVRTCPICQWRRGRMWQARAFKRLPLLIEQNPTARYGLLTLTARNCHVTELKSSIQDLKIGYKKLSSRLVVKKFVLGSAWSIEVTRRFDGSAHHHMHVLLVGKTSIASGRAYLSNERWSNLWKKCMNLDYEPIVHCKWFPKKNGQDELNQIVGTLRYMTKESSIPSDSRWFRAMMEQTHGARFVGCTGLIGESLRERSVSN